MKDTGHLTIDDLQRIEVTIGSRGICRLNGIIVGLQRLGSLTHVEE